jgi:hypothetical protein
VNGATIVYSDDPDVVKLGQRCGFDVIGVAQLPEPPAATPDLFSELGAKKADPDSEE